MAWFEILLLSSTEPPSSSYEPTVPHLHAGQRVFPLNHHHPGPGRARSPGDSVCRLAPILPPVQTGRALHPQESGPRGRGWRPFPNPPRTGCAVPLEFSLFSPGGRIDGFR